MTYDFTTVPPRVGRDSIAANFIPFPGVTVDEGVEPIPMWVADMSFRTAPPVLEAMRERLDFPSFGYYVMPDAYYDAIFSWQRRRNGVEGLSKEHIGYENGVLGGISSAIQALTRPGEKILVHSPTYVGFTHVLENTGRPAVHSPLVRDEDGIWRMDYDDMDKKLTEHDIRVAIFCTPHNPTGRVWELWELEKAMEVYQKHHCIVLSDEIWSDLILPGHKHIPTQSVSEDARSRTIAFYSPSKTFSLAGLIGSYHICYNEPMRRRIQMQAAMSHYNNANVLSTHALIGAYDRGEAWLEELLQVLDGNARYACDFIRANFPGVFAARPQGTYMLFADCSGWCEKKGESVRELMHRGVRAGVIWQDGEAFFLKNAIRMNLALPHDRLAEAFDRLKEKVFV